MYSETFRQT